MIPAATALQLVQLQQNAASAWAEMQPAVATAMRRVDVLKPYARKPYTTRALYLGISFPTTLFLVPFLLAVGGPSFLASCAGGLITVAQLSAAEGPAHSPCYFSAVMPMQLPLLVPTPPADSA